MKFTKQQAEALYGVIANCDEFQSVAWYAGFDLPYIHSDNDDGHKDAATLLREMADALDGGKEGDSGGQKQD